MKKFLLTVLLACLCMLGTACSGGAWVKEGTEKLGGDIRSGEFVLNGDVYSFPMDMSVWLNNGWHVSNNYENKNSFKLEPGGTSTEFELYNKEGDFVTVCVVNLNDKEAKVADCTVWSLEVPMSEYKAVLPGGVYGKSSRENITGAYGKADDEETEGGAWTAWYEFTSKDNWQCEAEIEVSENKGSGVTKVFYTMLDIDENWSQVWKKTINGDTCTGYIDLAMKTSFYGDYADYVKAGWDSEEGAKALYESEVTYYAQVLMYYSDVNETYLSEEMVQTFKKVARRVLKSTTWEVQGVTFDKDTLTGTVEIVMYPTDYFSLIDSEIETAIKRYQMKYADFDFENCTESEYAAAEEYYSDIVLDGLQMKSFLVKKGDPVKKTYNLDYNNGILSSEDWEDIDAVIMGLGGSAE